MGMSEAEEIEKETISSHYQVTERKGAIGSDKETPASLHAAQVPAVPLRRR